MRLSWKGCAISLYVKFLIKKSVSLIYACSVDMVTHSQFLLILINVTTKKRTRLSIEISPTISTWPNSSGSFWYCPNSKSKLTRGRIYYQFGELSVLYTPFMAGRYLRMRHITLANIRIIISLKVCNWHQHATSDLNLLHPWSITY